MQFCAPNIPPATRKTNRFVTFKLEIAFLLFLRPNSALSKLKLKQAKPNKNHKDFQWMCASCAQIMQSLRFRLLQPHAWKLQPQDQLLLWRTCTWCSPKLACTMAMRICLRNLEFELQILQMNSWQSSTLASSQPSPPEKNASHHEKNEKKNFRRFAHKMVSFVMILVILGDLEPPPY